MLEVVGSILDGFLFCFFFFVLFFFFFFVFVFVFLFLFLFFVFFGENKQTIEFVLLMSASSVSILLNLFLLLAKCPTLQRQISDLS